MYIVVREENNLDECEYGVNVSLYLVGIFTIKETADKAVKQYTGSKIIEAQFEINEILKPWLSTDEIMAIPFNERHERIKALIESSNHFQPKLCTVSYIE